MTTGRALGYLVALSLSGALLASPYRVGVVCGKSMDPSFRDGQVYLLDRAYYRDHAPQRGEVVLLGHEGATLIKRVVAVGGDTVHLIRFHAGPRDELVMDWELRRLQRVVSHLPMKNTVSLVSLRLRPGECFVVGDNTLVSEDSRQFGPVRADTITGKVLFTGAPQDALEHVSGSFSSPSHS
jgi:signal peptidase I